MRVLLLYFIANELARMMTFFFPLRAPKLILNQQTTVAQVVRMGRWVGGWNLIKMVLRFSSMSSIVTRNVDFFSKYGLQSGRLTRRKTTKNYDGHRKLSPASKLSKVFSKNWIKKNDFKSTYLEKAKSSKTNPKVICKILLRS